MNVNKNNLVANELREAGNLHYKSKEFLKALICYNKSICNAIAGSKEFALGLANRSAVYMELEEYDLCLENIDLALDCGYPEEKYKTLIQRREKCLDMREVHETDPDNDPWSFFRLTHPAIEKLPFVSSCVKLQSSKRFGRFLITTQALKTGDIICIEEPFHKFMLNNSRFSNCVNCLKSEKLDLFPCLQCNLAMYCSKACMESDSFHGLECQRSDVDLEIENDVFEVPHRMVFKALGIFERIGKLQKFVEDHSEVKTIFDFDLAIGGDMRQKEKFRFQAVHSLLRNEIPEKLKPAMDRHVEIMQSITENPKHRKFLDEFMRKQMEIYITNSYGFRNRGGDCIGSGIFPLASFFNHSCSPNVSRITVDNKLAFITTRPIEKNQQLFVCYRDNFMRTSKATRQDYLLKSYRFQCSCEACAKNFAVIDDLFTDDFWFVEPPTEMPPAREAKLEFKSNCAYIDKHIKNYPNSEICTLMERNREILSSLGRVASIKP